MPQTPAASTPDPDQIAWQQQTALLDTTLTRIIRYATQMKADLGKGEINLANADQLGHAVLTTLKQAAVIADRAEAAARRHLVSDCCSASLRVAGRGMRYWVCRECGEACEADSGEAVA
jgi:hypothetical protein